MPAEKLSSIGERIVFRRKQLRITQTELAKQLGVDAVSVSRWETNGVKPTRNIHELCTALQVSSSWLLNGTDNPPLPWKGSSAVEPLKRIPLDSLKKRFGKLSSETIYLAFRIERMDDADYKKIEAMIGRLEDERGAHPGRYQDDHRRFE